MVRWWRGRGDALRTAAAAMWRRNAAGGYHTIDAVPREHTGRRAASKERAFGRIPAVVVATGKGAPVSRKQLITFDKHQIDSLFRDSSSFTSSTFDLQIRAGVGSTVVLESGNVVPVKVHKNVETGQVLNVVMAWADESSELKVHVPVVFNGEDNCPGLKKGGYLHKLRTSLKYLCPSEHIPRVIEADISNLDIGDSIYARDIEVHPSLQLLWDDSSPICTILPTKPAEPARNENTETPVAK